MGNTTTGEARRNKERKRAEAAERQEYYNSLTTDQKIARARKARGESKKVLAKLEKVND